MKTKILVLTSTFPRWRNDSDPPFVYNLSKRLTSHFDVYVHAPHFPGAETDESMDGIQIHRFRYFFASWEKLAGSTGILPTLRGNKLYYVLIPFFLLAQFFSLLLFINKIRPDIIHAHWIIPQGLVAVLVRFFYPVPVVVTAHGADLFGLQGRLFQTLKRFTLQRVQGCTVVSRPMAKIVEDLIPTGFKQQIKTTIIPMGVDATVFSPAGKDPSIREQLSIHGLFLLYVGRLTEKKGVRYLIDAMSLLIEDQPDAKLLIIGKGELEVELKEHVRNLGLSQQVYFAGSIPNSRLPVYYASADIFVGPSIEIGSGDREGFGLTFIEAAMSGCLIIGTDSGGIVDIITDKETGLLISEKDSKAIADCIMFAVRHEQKAACIRARGRQKCIDQFDWKVIAGKYNDFLSSLLQ